MYLFPKIILFQECRAEILDPGNAGRVGHAVWTGRLRGDKKKCNLEDEPEITMSSSEKVNSDAEKKREERKATGKKKKPN